MLKGCLLTNLCQSKTICCHFCSKRDCMERCKDCLDTCRFRVEYIKPDIEKPEDATKNNVKNNVKNIVNNKEISNIPPKDVGNSLENTDNSPKNIVNNKVKNNDIPNNPGVQTRVIYEAGKLFR